MVPETLTIGGYERQYRRSPGLAATSRRIQISQRLSAFDGRTRGAERTDRTQEVVGSSPTSSIVA